MVAYAAEVTILCWKTDNAFQKLRAELRILLVEGKEQALASKSNWILSPHSTADQPISALIRSVQHCAPWSLMAPESQPGEVVGGSKSRASS